MFKGYKNYIYATIIIIISLIANDEVKLFIYGHLPLIGISMGVIHYILRYVTKPETKVEAKSRSSITSGAPNPDREQK